MRKYRYIYENNNQNINKLFKKPSDLVYSITKGAYIPQDDYITIFNEGLFSFNYDDISYNIDIEKLAMYLTGF